MTTRRTPEDAARWLAQAIGRHGAQSYITDAERAFLDLIHTNPSGPVRDRMQAARLDDPASASPPPPAPDTVHHALARHRDCQYCRGPVCCTLYREVEDAVGTPHAPGKVEEAIKDLQGAAWLNGHQGGGQPNGAEQVARTALLDVIEADKAAEVEHRNAESHHFALKCQSDLAAMRERADSLAATIERVRNVPRVGYRNDDGTPGWYALGFDLDAALKGSSK